MPLSDTTVDILQAPRGSGKSQHTDRNYSETGAALQLSVVMPCLNEVLTLAACIQKAQTAMKTLGLRGEIIIADNGSTDGSQALAESLGARVVPIAARGYGSALRGGIAAARGEWIVMGDADDSYDFSRIADFAKKLEE